MTAWTWLTWPDLLVDFGRELYVAWRLAEGDRLYADVAYLNGPLSPHWNAAVFAAAGTSIRNLALANLALGVAAVALLWRLLGRASDEGSAALACAVFLLLFAFAQYSEVGNYNFVAPYSHELTHGLLLSLIALACLDAHARSGSFASLLGAGFAAGLSALTKPEILAGCVAGLAVGWGALIAWDPERRRTAALDACALALAALLPVALALGALSLSMPAGEALAGTLGPWRALLTTDVAELPFYRLSLGTNDPPGNLLRLLRWSAILGAIVAATALAARFAPAGGPRGWLAAGGAFAIAAALTLGASKRIQWGDAFAPLPAVLGAMVVWRAARRPPAAQRPRAALQLALLVWALALLAKVWLNARIFHYGFALAAPGVLLLCVAMWSWAPRALARAGGSALLFRAVALALLLGVAVGYLRPMARLVDGKSYEIGAGADSLRTQPRLGRPVEMMLEHLSERMHPGDSLVAVPEGVMLNYLLRAPNPTPHVNFMPPELIIFGEDAMLDSLRAAPPEWIAVVHKDTGEYGARFFGRDYGTAISGWIEAHYAGVARIGDEPLVPDSHFGIRLLRRRASSATD